MTIKKEYIPPQMNSWVDQAKDLAKEFSKRKALRTGSGIGLKTFGFVAVAAAAGAAIAYFFDPVSGQERREKIRKRTMELQAKTVDTMKESFTRAKSKVASNTDSTQIAPSVH